MPAPTLEALAAQAATCTACRLAETRTTVVFGVGGAQSGLLVVGEGPGREEDLRGEPFVGRSGQLLDRLVHDELGLTRASYYITNVVKCRPPGNRDPAPDEIDACAAFLHGQVDLLDPRVVLTLGNVATRVLLGTTEGISTLRGRSHAWRGRVLIPTFHPAYALRGGGVVLAQMRADLVRVKRALKHAVSDRVVVRCDTEAATQDLAARVAALVRPGQVVELVGELGAGKTAFAKGYARALGVTATVTSPTFTLVHQYRCGPGSPVAVLLHADLWRLEGPDELGDLALEESLADGAAALVEWGDRFEVAPGHDRVVVSLSVLGTLAREVAVDVGAAGLGRGATAGLAT